MKGRILVVLLCLLFSSQNSLAIDNGEFDEANGKIKMEIVNVTDGAMLSEIMGKQITNTHYIIRHEHDLSRYDGGLVIGNNCTLEFKKGGFKNGKIKCMNITIKGRKPLFVDTYIEIEDADNIYIQNVNAAYSYAVDDFLKVYQSKNIIIEGVKVVFDSDHRQLANGDYIEAEGFDLTRCQNVSIERCSIVNSKSHYADSEHGSLACKECNNVTVNGCYSSGGHNEIFNFIRCKNVAITNTEVEDGHGSAIATQGGEGFVIENCKALNVLASGFSLNSKRIRISNCIAKDWHEFNGITLGHPADGARASDVVVSNCKLLLSDNRDSHKKCAFGGVVDGTVVISNCQTRTGRICSFDGVYRGQDVSLTFDNNYFNCFEGDTFAETFRASGILDLAVSHNTFIGNANITGFIKKKEGGQPSNWRINSNRFKKLKNVAIIPPGVKDNTSEGVFEFSNNVIENIDVTTIRYYSGRESTTNELIAIPGYARRIIYGNQIKKVKGSEIVLFKSSASEGLETLFEENLINSANVKDVLDLSTSQIREDAQIKIKNNKLLKGARIKSLL